MTSLILYSTLNPEGDDYQSIVVGNRIVFIRGESHTGNLLDALDAARPRDGETVLNSIQSEG